ncbi:hypothetical protein [Denitratisoma sp. agr-D3]
MDSTFIENLAIAIIDYLQRHPKSADTLSGIHAWWLPSELALQPQLTEKALDLLVSRGQLESVTIGNNKIYRRPMNV